MGNKSVSQMESAGGIYFRRGKQRVSRHFCRWNPFVSSSVFPRRNPDFDEGAALRHLRKKPPTFVDGLSAFLRMTGLEPARAQCPLEPESSASASSATSAHLSALDYNNAPGENCKHFFSLNLKIFTKANPIVSPQAKNLPRPESRGEKIVMLVCYC